MCTGEIGLFCAIAKEFNGYFISLWSLVSTLMHTIALSLTPICGLFYLPADLGSLMIV